MQTLRMPQKHAGCAPLDASGARRRTCRLRAGRRAGLRVGKRAGLRVGRRAGLRIGKRAG